MLTAISHHVSIMIQQLTPVSQYPYLSFLSRVVWLCQTKPSFLDCSLKIFAEKPQNTRKLEALQLSDYPELNIVKMKPTTEMYKPHSKYHYYNCSELLARAVPTALRLQCTYQPDTSLVFFLSLQLLNICS